MTKLKQFLKKIWAKKWLRYSFLSLAILLITGELLARFYLGLGDNPIYIEDSDYEYIYAPNQDVKRFGNRITTNKYSMRSKELSPKDKTKVLLIGDSVVNGGAHVDQDDLMSSVLENIFSKQKKGTRVLNISAGSWGPDNAFAYIVKHGHFNAEAIVLVFSSHDYNDNMHHKKVVGEHRSWPNSSYSLALADGFYNYALPKIRDLLGYENNEYAYLEGHDDSPINSGWQDFFDYCKDHEIKLLVYVHPEVGEIKNKALMEKGQNLIKMLVNNNINFINGLYFETNEQGYRDNIHLNGKGHHRLAAILQPHIEKLIFDKF
jgi:hypothetical protein